MAHLFPDSVRDTTTTTGTSNVTVSGSAPVGYITFSQITGIATNDTFWYAIRHQVANEWETGLGTWLGSNVIARTTIITSSNSGAAVNFSAGTKDIFIGPLASKVVQVLPNGTVNLPAGSTLNGGSFGGMTLLIEGTNLVEQRNGVNPQEFRVYSYWNASGVDTEFGRLMWLNDRFVIRASKSGSGVNRAVAIYTDNADTAFVFNKNNGSITGFYGSAGSYTEEQASLYLGGSASLRGVDGYIQFEGVSASSPVKVEIHNTTSTQQSHTLGVPAKDRFGGYTGDGHHLTVHAGKGSAQGSGAHGGNLYVVGGDGAGSGNNNGGHLYLRGGAKVNSGTAGSVIMDNLPTSSAGLPSGALWIDTANGRVLKQVA